MTGDAPADVSGWEAKSAPSKPSVPWAACTAAMGSAGAGSVSGLCNKPGSDIDWAAAAAAYAPTRLGMLDAAPFCPSITPSSE